MIKYSNKKVIEVDDWDKLVEETYKRPYSFQQQDGCKERQTVNITVPSEYTEDKEMNDSIPEVVNGDKMGVKFDIWLARDPNEKLKNKEDQHPWSISLWWERNFYPDVNMVINDLYKKGLLEAGEYSINIDW